MRYASPAQAAYFIVSKTSSSFGSACDSDCSLCEAVQAANLTPGFDTILLPMAVYGGAIVKAPSGRLVMGNSRAAATALANTTSAAVAPTS